MTKKGTTKTAPKGKGKRMKQETLPGESFARKSITAIDEAAEAYRQARDERMALTKQETDAHATLLGVMKESGIKPGEKYVYVDDEGDELEVYVDDVVKVKVKKVKNAKAKSDE